MLGDALVPGVVVQDVGEGQPESLLDFGDLVLAITVERAPEGRTVTTEATVGSVSCVEQLPKASQHMGPHCAKRKGQTYRPVQQYQNEAPRYYCCSGKRAPKAIVQAKVSYVRTSEPFGEPCAEAIAVVCKSTRN